MISRDFSESEAFTAEVAAVEVEMGSVLGVHADRWSEWASAAARAAALMGFKRVVG